ncbi:hypothetical protein BDF19DRAFT_414048 [Syncephalis fuscata]|nr:hypothetical protein BDF19DRAFT_414048 [Syncephalis fuscata]
MGKKFLMQVAEWKPQLILRLTQSDNAEEQNRWCPWLDSNAQRVLQLCVLNNDEFTTMENPKRACGLEWHVYGQVIDAYDTDFDVAVRPQQSILQLRMTSLLHALVTEQLTRLQPQLQALATVIYPESSSSTTNHSMTVQHINYLKHIHIYLTGIERVAQAVLKWLSVISLNNNSISK